MTVTRLVIGGDSAGGVTVTIGGNKLTFPAAYGGPPGGYTTSNFVYNINKDEYKAITSITADTDYFNAFSDVTVGSIGTWVDTDKYALARTALASPTHTTFQAAFSATAADDEEIVVLPPSSNSFGLVPASISGSTFDVLFRGWSPQQKILGMGPGWLIDHEANLTMEDFDLILQSEALRPSIITSTGLSWIFNRIRIANTFSRCFTIDPGSVGAGFTLTCNSCIASSGLLSNGFINNNSGSTFICHNCVGAGFASFRRLAGTFKVFNCIAHFFYTNDSSTLQFGGTFDAASDFNAAMDATAPGSSSKQSQTAAQIGMAWDNSPEGVDSQYPFFEFRTVDSAGGNMKDNGSTVAGAPLFDFNGFKCPTTGVRTIGACNFSTNNGGVKWPGFGVGIAAAPGKTTLVSAVAGNARLEMAFTTPALSDRVGMAIATASSDAVSLANGGIFAAIIRNLAASTAFSQRSIAELVGGVNLPNGVAHKVIVVAGNSDDAFNSSAVEGDVVTGTPSSGVTAVNTPPTLVVDRLDKDGTLRFSISNTGGAAWQIQVFDVTEGKELVAITGAGDLSDQTHPLKGTNTYKLVPMTTTVGNRSDANEPVWVGSRVGVND